MAIAHATAAVFMVTKNDSMRTTLSDTARKTLRCEFRSNAVLQPALQSIWNYPEEVWGVFIHFQPGLRRQTDEIRRLGRMLKQRHPRAKIIYMLPGGQGDERYIEWLEQIYSVAPHRQADRAFVFTNHPGWPGQAIGHLER